MKHSPLSLLLAASLLACGDPPVDDGDGGTAPEPTGVLEGTVLYVGPRPRCADNEAGVRLPVGRVVLTLFAFDDPPAPEGSASSALNLLTIPGPLLFTSLDDCLPDEPTLDDRRVFITRSVGFTWPEIPLGEDGPVEYQVRGFYDYDADFNPFFSVTNQPTAGDVIGGAIADPSASVITFVPIRFGTRDANPLGELRGGVTVTLAAPVNTERPVFRLASGPLSSESTFPLVPDPLEQERLLWEATETRLTLYGRDPDDPATAALRGALEAGGLELDTANPFAYAWFVRDLDVDRDGAGDPHPLLGSQGFAWKTPAPLMRRVRERPEIEAAARIPEVLLFPSVRPSQTAAQEVFFPDIEVLVPPIALLRTAPDPRCTIPVVPPGNIAPLYERGTTDCQELPAARYDTTVFHGVAAAVPVGGGLERCDADPTSCAAGTTCVDGACLVLPPTSATGTNLSSGAYSGQAWTIPNELGDATQVGADRALPDQGLAGLFVVQDPDPSTPSGTPPPSCAMALDPIAMAPRAVAYTNFAEHGEDAEAVRALCCGPIAHLCDVPLCPAVDAGGGSMVRPGPSSLAADGLTPDCVPFPMPAACCGR